MPPLPPPGRRAALSFAAVLALALPAAAQEAPGPAPEAPPSLIEQGIALLLRGLMNEVAPEIGDMTRDLHDGAQRLLPALDDLARLVDDIGNYQMPERLANGDILIRRKPGAPPPPPLGESWTQPTPPEDTPPAPDPEAPRLDL